MTLYCCHNSGSTVEGEQWEIKRKYGDTYLRENIWRIRLWQSDNCFTVNVGSESWAPFMLIISITFCLHAYRSWILVKFLSTAVGCNMSLRLCRYMFLALTQFFCGTNDHWQHNHMCNISSTLSNLRYHSVHRLRVHFLLRLGLLYLVMVYLGKECEQCRDCSTIFSQLFFLKWLVFHVGFASLFRSEYLAWVVWSLFCVWVFHLFIVSHDMSLVACLVLLLALLLRLNYLLTFWC